MERQPIAPFPVIIYVEEYGWTNTHLCVRLASALGGDMELMVRATATDVYAASTGETEIECLVEGYDGNPYGDVAQLATTRDVTYKDVTDDMVEAYIKNAFASSWDKMHLADMLSSNPHLFKS